MSIILFTIFTAYLIGSISLKGIILWLSPPKKFPNLLNRTFALKTPRITIVNFLFDYLKGILGAYAIYSMTNSELLIVIWGIGLIIGNTWSIFSRFKEKSSYTVILGLLSYINFVFTILLVFLGIILFVLLNHPELSLVISSTALPFLIMAFSGLGIHPTYVLFGIFVAVFVPIKLRNKFPTILEEKGNNLIERFKKRNLST